MKNESFDIANMPKYGYINRALSKISKLALVGYEYSAHTVRLKGFLYASFLYAFACYGEAGGKRSRLPVT